MRSVPSACDAALLQGIFFFAKPEDPRRSDLSDNPYSGNTNLHLLPKTIRSESPAKELTGVAPRVDSTRKQLDPMNFSSR
jgi:hypothetical protein